MKKKLSFAAALFHLILNVGTLVFYSISIFSTLMSANDGWGLTILVWSIPILAPFILVFVFAIYGLAVDKFSYESKGSTVKKIVKLLIIAALASIPMGSYINFLFVLPYIFTLKYPLTKENYSKYIILTNIIAILCLLSLNGRMILTIIGNLF